MSAYLDASVLVALTDVDLLKQRAVAFVEGCSMAIVVSDFAMAEVASALARQVRTHALTPESARTAMTGIRAWTSTAAERELLQSADVASAETTLARFELTLKTGDAIHIAVAQRIGATLVTFDRKQAESARKLGSAVIEP